MLRTLNFSEITAVSGGLEVDSFEDGGYNGDFYSEDYFSSDGGGGGGGGGDNYPQLTVDFGNDLNDSTVTYNGPNENDIYVTATPSEVQDAKESYTIANIIVNGVEFGSMAAGALGSVYGGSDAVKATASLLGALTPATIAENKATVTNFVANSIYAGMRNGSFTQMGYAFSAVAQQ